MLAVLSVVVLANLNRSAIRETRAIDCITYAACVPAARTVRGEPASVFPVVVFDLDGTLLRDTSVSLMLADWLGRTRDIAELERAFHAHEISNSVVADVSAEWLAGARTADAWRVLADGPWIVGMADTFQALTSSGVSILLGTITWRFAAEMLREPHGFAAVSGTEMQAVDGVLSGVVSRHFDEHDKAYFVEDWCARNGYSMDQVAAVGDSRSDIPLFRRAGLSIALNANPDARDAATHQLDTEDLRDVLALLRSG
jgi:phosphoserine phosphatase